MILSNHTKLISLSVDIRFNTKKRNSDCCFLVKDKCFTNSHSSKKSLLERRVYLSNKNYWYTHLIMVYCSFNYV